MESFKTISHPDWVWKIVASEQSLVPRLRGPQGLNANCFSLSTFHLSTCSRTQPPHLLHFTVHTESHPFIYIEDGSLYWTLSASFSNSMCSIHVFVSHLLCSYFQLYHYWHICYGDLWSGQSHITINDCFTWYRTMSIKDSKEQRSMYISDWLHQPAIISLPLSSGLPIPKIQY